MNWFTWTVIVLGVLLVGSTVVSIVRPRRATIDDDAKLREKNHAEGMYRGGTLGGFGPGNMPGGGTGGM
ncbi:hypothetical protein GCM10022237_03710 [Nocardioides ginsengisoli]|uniref:Uncharacterized protein n=1 Tax=Nocardioides ginsengisoli TaxID=363868 RepID=A0ABW3VYQ2_9ACTN